MFDVRWIMIVKNKCQNSDQKVEKGTKFVPPRIFDLSVNVNGYIISTKDWHLKRYRYSDCWIVRLSESSQLINTVILLEVLLCDKK